MEEELVQALAKQVDGVLLCSPRMSNDLIEKLRPRGAAGRGQPGRSTGCRRWSWTSAQGARLAIEHLAGLGHRDIALLGGPRGSWTNREIRRSATAAAKAGGRPDRARPQPADRGRRRSPRRAVRATGATAVLAYNDLMAIGLLEGLHDRGVRRPGRAQRRRDRRHRAQPADPPQADHGGHPDRGRRAGRPSTCCCSTTTTAAPTHWSTLQTEAHRATTHPGPRTQTPTSDPLPGSRTRHVRIHPAVDTLPATALAAALPPRPVLAACGDDAATAPAADSTEAGRAEHLLVGRRRPGQAHRRRARALHEEAPQRHVQEDVAGQPGIFRQARDPDRGRQRARHLPDRRQRPRRSTRRATSRWT